MDITLEITEIRYIHISKWAVPQNDLFVLLNLHSYIYINIYKCVIAITIRLSVIAAQAINIELSL